MGSSGHGQDAGSRPGAGADAGRGRALHGPVSGPVANPVCDDGRSEAGGAGSGDRLGAPPCRFISQRMTVTTMATPVAAAMATKPPAIHCVAMTASPERDDPVLCTWSSPAASAPAR
jgi:hypothetical protein